MCEVANDGSVLDPLHIESSAGYAIRDIVVSHCSHPLRYYFSLRVHLLAFLSFQIFVGLLKNVLHILFYAIGYVRRGGGVVKL